MKSVPSTICINLINFYQIFLSFDRGILSVFAPGGACRYSQSCSEYTKQMIIKEGILKGIFLGIRRIISCR
jgi:putative component of membrane protein insertase Oxa1/YidC/SpoIIIJ protein YidD